MFLLSRHESRAETVSDGCWSRKGRWPQNQLQKTCFDCRVQFGTNSYLESIEDFCRIKVKARRRDFKLSKIGSGSVLILSLSSLLFFFFIMKFMNLKPGLNAIEIIVHASKNRLRSIHRLSRLAFIDSHACFWHDAFVIVFDLHIFTNWITHMQSAT